MAEKKKTIADLDEEIKRLRAKISAQDEDWEDLDLQVLKLSTDVNNLRRNLFSRVARLEEKVGLPIDTNA